MSFHSNGGCTATVFGLPPHNPEPSTERGKRRFAKLDPKQQEQRRAKYNIARSVKESRFQKRLKLSRGHG